MIVCRNSSRKNSFIWRGDEKILSRWRHFTYCIQVRLIDHARIFFLLQSPDRQCNPYRSPILERCGFSFQLEANYRCFPYCRVRCMRSTLFFAHLFTLSLVCWARLYKPLWKGGPGKNVSTSTPSIYFYQTQNKSIINILHQVLSLNRRGHVVRRRTQAAETVDAHIRQIFKFFPAVN